MCRGAQAHAGWPLRHAVPENSKAMPYACSMGEPLLEGLPAAQHSLALVGSSRVLCCMWCAMHAAPCGIYLSLVRGCLRQSCETCMLRV